MTGNWETSNSAYGSWWKNSQPLVPKVNLYSLDQDSFTKEKSILRKKLDKFALKEKIIKGDGNCQFRALADQIYGENEEYDAVRLAVVAQLREYPERYCEYVPESYEQYMNNMERDGTWGDHVTLQACADRFGMQIYLITSYQDENAVKVIPAVQKSDKILFLSFWAEIHYNSVHE
mmetsp:Transcript_28161/g.38935  ORF Transcript_28161/g.38935 Transcript_28161/m.38935 type:complete len:176 (-) Transcript_28161:814-1341(-)|eukprot:CAMPEP_0196589560 /NCGR_PEP_ID=MMETSP1081-20130531/63919_1 /TAXON_ID=36882 /ORGANISM="Pyramimonas amylifera, Strain CCMP720" /LENGTH=175 /DNA_ID=CAMNT_0041912403 /DNA_START=181 /DNA_END=708 /DNA_ORIENTATION=+